jgi:hypothetical protein
MCCLRVSGFGGATQPGFRLRRFAALKEQPRELKGSGRLASVSGVSNRLFSQIPPPSS